MDVGRTRWWSRRRLLEAGGLAGAAALTAPLAGAAVSAAAPPTGSREPVEPNAGRWRTWLLRSGDELRLPAPPAGADAERELGELRALIERRDAATRDRIAYWDAGSPGYRWQEIANDLSAVRGWVGNRAARVLALLNVAIADATIAAWDTKYAYRRPRPAEADPILSTLVPTPNSPAYPSEHAVTAGAAAAVLGHLFPNQTDSLAAWADEAGRSRMCAGTDYASDVAAGLALGRAVGARVVEWAQADGSDAVWTGSVLRGPGLWNGTDPIEPMAGTWQTWVLDRPDRFRPGPRAAYNSPELAAEMAELKNYPRTNAINLIATYWEYFGGARAHRYWNDHVGRKLLEYRLDLNPPRAARAYACQATAYHDALVACWDAKYAYWTIRPFQLDRTVTTVFTTPNHPSYPAAHSTIAGAMAVMMSHLFPRDAATFERITQEEGWSRLWAGIHLRSDIEAGFALGRAVADLVVERARRDGAD